MKITSKTAEEIDEAGQKDNLKFLEAVFFVSGRFLSMSELVSITDLNPVIILNLIDKLKERYYKADSAIEIIKKNDLWKMGVCPEYSHVINKLATGSVEFSKAEQETLAIIAFKQPIKQSIIVKIRGNKAYEHVRKFVDLELIKKKKVGRTHELTLGDEFYDYFNLRNSKKISDGHQNSERILRSGKEK